MQDAALVCTGKICQTAPSTVLWKTVSVYWGIIFFFCMSVLHLYNKQREKREAVFEPNPIQTFSWNGWQSVSLKANRSYWGRGGCKWVFNTDTGACGPAAHRFILYRELTVTMGFKWGLFRVITRRHDRLIITASGMLIHTYLCQGRWHSDMNLHLQPS